MVSRTISNISKWRTKMKKQLVKITVDRVNYLGTIDGNTIQGVTTPHFEDYIKAKALGELVTVTVGDARNLVITHFTDEQLLELDRVKSLYKLAEKKTLSTVTCQIFDKLLGK
jgi:hypothetical protein